MGGWLSAAISVTHLLVGGERLVPAGILGLEEVLPLLELASLHGLLHGLVSDLCIGRGSYLLATIGVREREISNQTVLSCSDTAHAKNDELE